MRTSLRTVLRLWDVVLGWLVVVASGLGLPVAVPIGLLRRAPWSVGVRGLRPWIWISLPLGLLALGTLLQHREAFSWWLLGEAAILTAAGLVLRIDRKTAVVGLLSALAVLSVCMVSSRALSTWGWNPLTLDRVVGVVTGVTRLDGKFPGRTASRRYRIPVGTRRYVVGMDVRWAEPPSDQRWALGSGSSVAMVTQPDGRVVARLQPGDATRLDAGFTFRTNPDLPSAQRRVRVVLRSARGATCGQISVSSRGTPTDGERVCLRAEWTTLEVPVNGIGPTSGAGAVLRLEGFRGPVAVRELALERDNGSRWVRQYDVMDRSIRVDVYRGDAWTPRTLLGHTYVAPTDVWRHVEVRGTWSGGAGAGTAAAVVTVPWGQSIEVRGVTFRGDGATNPRRIANPSQQRQSLWFPQENVAGHAATTVLVALLALTGSIVVALLAVPLWVATIYLTGSRAALLGALLGVPWLLGLALRRRHRVWSTLITISAALSLVGVFWVGNFGRLVSTRGYEAAAATRSEIWGTALDAMRAHPWTGLGDSPGAFAAFWSRTHPGLLATHAHDLWLQFAASYGVPGLVAAVWLAVAFVVAAWRLGRWRGLIVAISVLSMQVFDYTFFTVGVLATSIVALNALALSRSREGAPSTTAWARKGPSTQAGAPHDPGQSTDAST